MLGSKVMIVDDNKEFLEELQELLVMSGYEVAAFSDPALAMEEAAKVKPQLILLDLKMPGKNGFQLASEIRRSPELEHIPIIAMSAYFKDEYASLLNICDIKNCIRKPFHPLDVIAGIEEALKEGGGDV